MTPFSRMLKLVITAIAAVFAALGVAALATGTHTGQARWQGMVTLEGEAAFAAGHFFLVMSTLGLLVWLPDRFRAAGLALWWLGMMAALAALLMGRL